jgi:hypothetical protein
MVDQANQNKAPISENGTNLTEIAKTGTLQKIEKIISEKEINNNNWVSLNITLWPIVAVFVLFIFKKQFAAILHDLAGFTFGSFSVKLRRRMSKVADEHQIEKIKLLSAYDLKIFFVIASQSWKIEKVIWKFSTHESLKVHEKLEDVGLLIIHNKSTAIQENVVKATLTHFGEELYQEISSLISESLR